jgi:hypothetical protein
MERKEKLPREKLGKFPATAERGRHSQTGMKNESEKNNSIENKISL